jgi:amino acid transporter
MATASVPVDRTTRAALEEKSKLQRHFRRFDILFFLICTVVGLDTLGAVASDGAQAFTWLIFLGIFFFMPYALLTSELGTAFPHEGGAYVWTKLAFGRFVAAVNAVIYWLANPIWLGGTLTILAVTAFSGFFTDISNSWTRYLFGLVFIWVAVWAAILSFRIGKWIPTIGAWVRMLVLAFFTLSVIVYGFKHGVHGFGAGHFKPSYGVFIAAVPVLFFNYVGFELPNAAGEEMHDPQRDVPYTVIRSAIGAIVLYGGPILAILLVLPTSAISSLGGFLDAMKTVFTVYGGHVGKNGATLSGAGKFLGDTAAIAFIIALLTSGTTWIMGADRSQAVAGFDGAAPRWLGIFSRRWGTPVVVNLLSGVVATIVMVLANVLTSGNSGKYFSAVLGLAISTTTISYLAIFPALIKLRYSHPEVRRPYRVPGGMAGVWIVGVLCTVWSALATVVLLWPGIFTGDPNGALPEGFGGQRLNYELTQFVPLAGIAALGVLFYVLGRATRADEVDEPITVEAATREGFPEMGAAQT